MKINNLPKEQPPLSSHDSPWVAILGNPNCGKTALFNRLTGLHHKVGNYPGITVEYKSGWLKGHKIMLRDFPGTYSLNAKSIDEKIVSDTVQTWREPKNRPRAAIVVVDVTNFSRNIYLALQILDWNVPTIIVLNMIDEARKKGLRVDVPLIQKRLNAWAVIPTSAKYGEGIQEIIDTIVQIPDSAQVPEFPPRIVEIERTKEMLEPLINFLKTHERKINHNALVETLRILSDNRYIENLRNFLPAEEYAELKIITTSVKTACQNHDLPFQSLEQTSRFGFIDLYLTKAISESSVRHKSNSEIVDGFLTHRILGPVILIAVLGFIFNAIFSWAEYPMNLIQSGVDFLSVFLNTHMADGLLKSLVVDGIVNGVGSILVFFPQILLLVFFLSILEDSGYMSRMAFIMDRLMGKLGLQGRSVLPLLSGFACAIPAVMSARTIENWRDRLITILIIPLMSCSARLPVYTLLIAAFVPSHKVLGFFSLQGMVLMGIYFLGMITAVFVALIFKKLFQRRPGSVMMMELPPYRFPLLRSIWWQLYDRGKSFLTTAGTIILAISIVLWFLATFPEGGQNEHAPASQQIEQSYAGKLGHFIEPVIKPLGFDWKIGVGLITSFAAREVIISTLSTIYNLEEEGQTNLIDAMRKDRHADGSPVFTPLVALSLMIFFAYAAQCMATFAIVKKETNSWRWPLVMVFYMTTLAYISSMIVFQVGSFLGY